MNKKVVDIDSISVEKLKEQLQYGDGVKIAQRSGYSLNYVWMVLNPKTARTNKDIVRAAIEVVQETQKMEIDADLADSLVA